MSPYSTMEAGQYPASLRLIFYVLSPVCIVNSDIGHYHALVLCILVGFFFFAVLEFSGASINQYLQVIFEHISLTSIFIE